MALGKAVVLSSFTTLADDEEGKADDDDDKGDFILANSASKTGTRVLTLVSKLGISGKGSTSTRTKMAKHILVKKNHLLCSILEVSKVTENNLLKTMEVSYFL